MNKYYITFGQDHSCRANGKTIDHNAVGVINASSYSEARQMAFDMTGGKFCSIYEDLEKVEVEKYYPRGLIEMN